MDKINEVFAKIYYTECNVSKLRKFYRSLNEEEQIYFLTNLNLDVEYLAKFAYGLWDKLLEYNLVLKLNSYYLWSLLQHINIKAITVPLKYQNEIFSRIMALGDEFNARAIYKRYFINYLKNSDNPKEIYDKFMKTKIYEQYWWFSLNNLTIQDFIYLSPFIKYKWTKELLKKYAPLKLSDYSNLLTFKDKEFFNKYILPNEDLCCSDLITIFVNSSKLMNKEREKEFIECYIEHNDDIEFYENLYPFIKFKDNEKIIRNAIFIHQLNS